jgi:23S rRNA (guanosine2251-2'-O)-methyltransferase
MSRSSEADAVVGRRPALEAVRSGAATEVLVASGARRSGALRDLLDAARVTGVPVRSAPVAEIARLSGGARHQGVAARLRVPPPLSEAELAGRPWNDDAVVVILDGVTDPRNVGGIARTAEAAGASAVVVRRRRGSGLTQAAVRASAGALLHLPVAEVANVARTLGRLRDAGFWVIGLDPAGQDLDTTDPPRRPLALVLGSEGEGLSRLSREACDELVAIAMGGRVSSLNVSVAAGVALFHPAFRRRKQEP